jgi:hypothetical protein
LFRTSTSTPTPTPALPPTASAPAIPVMAVVSSAETRTLWPALAPPFAALTVVLLPMEA